MSLKGIKTLFLVGALYDLILGFVFGLFYEPIYRSFAVEFPNHPGYIQLVACYILIFGIAFLWVWRDPAKNLPVIALGIMMKFAFCVVAFGHLIIDSIPVFYIPFAILDLVFLICFWMAWRAMKRLAAAA